MTKKAVLVLSDGTVHEGHLAGAPGTTEGEVVFATGMTGYQEMLTDPSFRGQILTFTYPLIGNYGINDDDVESSAIQVRGAVMKELCEKPSNWRSKKSLGDYLRENNITGIQGIDTRMLTRHLRIHGVMMGIISTEESTGELLKKIKSVADYGNCDFVREVSAKEPYQWTDGNVPTWDVIKTGNREQGTGNSFELGVPGLKLNDKDNPQTQNERLETLNTKPGTPRVVLVDYGVKYNILRLLTHFNFSVTVVPCTVSAEDILSLKPAGVMLSPGPGDPEKLDYAVKGIKEFLTTQTKANKNGRRIPVFAICLGHQILARAFGGKTFKLKFGHRGVNHPVKDMNTGKVYITSQNHGYAVDADSVKNSGFNVTHVHLNDGTVEGMENKELSVFSIQYHPEASPGPRDNVYMFDKFVKKVNGEEN